MVLGFMSGSIISIPRPAARFKDWALSAAAVGIEHDSFIFKCWAGSLTQARLIDGQKAIKTEGNVLPSVSDIFLFCADYLSSAKYLMVRTIWLV